MTKVPGLVARLTQIHDAWIVGSAAKVDQDLAKVRDWDIVVPFSKWKEAVLNIPKNARVNTFGGYKVKIDGTTIDVWPGDLAWLLSCDLTKYAWHPKTNSRWEKK